MVQLSVEAPWPYISNVSMKSLLQHFDEEVYDLSPRTHLYKLIYALAGETGAGDVLKQSLISRANQDIETTWFKDIDRLFSDILDLPRLPEESYDIDPQKDVLTQEELDEIMVKDAWYRARLKDLLQGLQTGGTVEGFKHIVRAVTSSDCDIYETYRYRDRFDSVGRLATLSDREVVIAPYKQETTEREKHVLLRVLDRLKPVDSFVTVSPEGLPVHKILDIKNVASDSSYFEITKKVINNVDMSSIPPPEYLAEELFKGQKWLYEAEKGKAVPMPNTPFSTSMEYAQQYIYDSKSSDQISKAEYLKKTGSKTEAEINYTQASSKNKMSDWVEFTLADSPDNYPGGKNGRTPM